MPPESLRMRANICARFQNLETVTLYDPVGNRLTADDGTTVTTSVYDAANRLQTAEDGSGVTTPAQPVCY